MTDQLHALPDREVILSDEPLDGWAGLSVQEIEAIFEGLRTPAPTGPSWSPCAD